MYAYEYTRVSFYEVVVNLRSRMLFGGQNHGVKLGILCVIQINIPKHKTVKMVGDIAINIWPQGWWPSVNEYSVRIKIKLVVNTKRYISLQQRSVGCWSCPCAWMQTIPIVSILPVNSWREILSDKVYYIYFYVVLVAGMSTFSANARYTLVSVFFKFEQYLVFHGKKMTIIGYN